jgi:uncharacterized OB-fold protein
MTETSPELGVRSAPGIAPLPDRDSQPFWDAAERGELVVQLCSNCGRRQYPPMPVCANCHSAELSWTPAPPSGRLYSWVVVHHPISEIYADQVPFAVGLVDCDGLRMVVRLEGPPEGLAAGVEVELGVRGSGGQLTIIGRRSAAGVEAGSDG